MGEGQRTFSHHVLCGILTLSRAVLSGTRHPGVWRHSLALLWLGFSGDRQDGEDKTSHELLAQRYLFPGKGLWDVFGMSTLWSITALGVGTQGALGVSASGGCPGAASALGMGSPAGTPYL